ncbi:MAG: aldose 1-epimerase [Alphaproteobacteria bacterium]|nr:aldose 1-epimerase [Alphaproteobacteria bacterium]
MSQAHQDPVKLVAGALSVTLAPEAGGGIARFERAGVPIFRPASAQALAEQNPRGMGCFPMVPFSGRVSLARFAWGEEMIALRPNFPGEPHAIHGDAWQAPWTMVAVGEQVAQMAYDHPGATAASGVAWPWPYRVEQTIDLTPDCLTLSLAIENRGKTPMPVGFGFHPYFQRTHAVTVMAEAPEVWIWDAWKRPAARIPTPQPWRLSPARPVAGLGLDHCFAAWTGQAEITWPEHGFAVQITAGAKLRHLVVFTPDADYFCVEPTSHAPDMLNLDPASLPVLAPGQSVSGGCRFTIHAL